MDIKLGTVINHHPISGKKGSYIYLACPDCKRERWVSCSYQKRTIYPGRCKSCAGKHHQHLFNKKSNCQYLTTEGYVMVQLKPSSFFYPMAERNGYIKEHRLIMAKHLGRCLMSFEIVHHINNKREDNRLENLKLGTPSDHVAYHNSTGTYRGKYTMKSFRHLY